MAVYTHLTHEEIAAWLATHYAVGSLVQAQGITQGVSNTNYAMTTQPADGTAAQRYILTLFEARTAPEDLPFFMQLMQHVAARGVACPEPILRRDGALYGPLAGKPATLISFLPGQSRTEFSVPQLTSAGALMGRLHKAMADFPFTRTNSMGLSAWETMVEGLRGTLDTIQPGLDAQVFQALDALRVAWPALASLPQGVIHADLFPDNIFFEGDTACGVIDFYFACTDALAYDLAIALHAWCFSADGQWQAAEAAALLAGYETVRPLTHAERDALPLLMRGAALRFLLTRAQDWLQHDPAMQVTPKDPRTYAARLAGDYPLPYPASGGNGA